MTGDGFDISILGSSLISSWWNGAATYYRGLVRNLAERGHRVTFYEPAAYDRQAHRDIDDPPWATVVVYAAEQPDDACAAVARAADGAQVVVKTSGVGVFDDVLEAEVAGLGGTTRVFCDVDAPATLARLDGDPHDPFRDLVAQFDLVVTYGGGEPVRDRYRAVGARRCELVYNGFDPSTHHRVPADDRFGADLSLLANRLPDREQRIDEFFFRAAALLPSHTFLLGGNGWEGKQMPDNVRWIGHVGTGDHNAFNCSAGAVLNVTRESMASNGWSPATRVFEATGVGACLITDEWCGIDDFFVPGSEVLVAADGAAVADHVAAIDPVRSRAIGDAAAQRVAACHDYAHRAAQLDTILREVVR